MVGLIPFNRKESNLFSPGFDEFSNVLDDFFADRWPMRRNLALDTFKVDVVENEGEYLIEAEMPGVKKEEIKLELQEGRLMIGVTKEEKGEEEKKNYLHKERRISSMERSIYLADAQEEDIKAKLEEGVLKISIPKKAKRQIQKQIEIE